MFSAERPQRLAFDHLSVAWFFEDPQKGVACDRNGDWLESVCPGSKPGQRTDHSHRPTGNGGDLSSPEMAGFGIALRRADQG
jgi:hypothetical protein